MQSLKFILLLTVTLFHCTINIKAETSPVNNVIILIPDGTSTGLVTLSRCYNDNKPLAIDPYICGMIKTHTADGRFPDSAPASTAYATGIKTKAPYIGLNDNAEPRVSVLELAKRKGMATGIVVTCEFPHATPADFVCHFNYRESNSYKNLAKQFIYNSPNLLFAGGENYIDENGYTDLLKPNNIKLITNKKAFEAQNNLSDTCLWCLFPDWQNTTKIMSYECDRDKEKVPGLSEMTEKAINLLSQNKNGFFLMVEGSQIDWALHNNDPYSAINDFLEFVKAVAVAIKFAKENKNTVVIISPDHGTGGIALGNDASGWIYENINVKEDIINPLKEIKCSGRKLAETMLKDTTYISTDSLKRYYHCSANADFVNSLKHIIKRKTAQYLVDTIQYLTGKRFSQYNFIGWTSTGHTAEDVFLAIYTPEHIPKITGVIDNYEVGKYIAKILDLDDFDLITKELYTKHTEYFNKEEIISLTADSLTVIKNGKKFSFESNSTLMKINEDNDIRLPSLIIWIDGTYYLPKSIEKYF